MLDTSPEISPQKVLILEVRKDHSSSTEFLVQGPFQDPTVSCKSGFTRHAVGARPPPSLCPTFLVSQRNDTSLSSTLILPTVANNTSTFDPALTWFQTRHLFLFPQVIGWHL